MKRFLVAVMVIMTIFVLGCTGSYAQKEAGANESSPLNALGAGSDVARVQANKERKILVAYFSHSGNTRDIAGQIRAAVGGDIFEIKTVKQYNKDFETTVAEATEEKRINARPALTAKVENMQDYDVIFLGFPNWCGTMPMALFSFLEQYDFQGKTIVPFCTHGSSGLSNTIVDLKKLAPKADVREALSLHRNEIRTADSTVQAWLKKTGYVN